MEIICPECKWTLANVIKGRLYLTEHSRLLESQHDRDYHFQCRGCGATRWHKTKDYSELAETQEKLRLARQQVDGLLERAREFEEDADRLAKEYDYGVCIHCDHILTGYRAFENHALDCPIILHKSLKNKWGGE